MLNKGIKIKNIFQFIKIEEQENLAKTNVFWFSLEFVTRFRNNWCLDILVLYNWRDARWSKQDTRYKIQEALFYVGYIITDNISYFPTKHIIKL